MSQSWNELLRHWRSGLYSCFLYAAIFHFPSHCASILSLYFSSNGLHLECAVCTYPYLPIPHCHYVFLLGLRCIPLYPMIKHIDITLNVKCCSSRLEKLCDRPCVHCNVTYLHYWGYVWRSTLFLFSRSCIFYLRVCFEIKQVYNFLRFCELLVMSCAQLKTIHLTTGSEDVCFDFMLTSVHFFS